MSIETVTGENFVPFIQSAPAVLVDFAAGDSRSPILEEVSAARPQIPLGMVDTDREYDLTNAYVVRTTPTLMLFRDGEISDRWTGQAHTSEVLEAIDRTAAPYADPASAPGNPVMAFSGLHDPTAAPADTGTGSPRLYASPIPGMPYGMCQGEYFDRMNPWESWQ